MNFETILFDSDGVLVETEQLFFDANSQVFEKIGIPHTRADFVDYTFITGAGTAGFLKRKGFDEQFIKLFWRKRDSLWYEMIKTGSPIKQEAEKLLTELSKTYKIVIVTNASKAIFEATYKNDKLLKNVDFIVTREEYTNAKPAPDCYDRALQELNTHPSQALAIEDSPRGIEAAQAAKIKTLGIKNLFFGELNTSNADYQISSLLEIPLLLGDTSWVSDL